jgi:hypothetical protein
MNNALLWLGRGAGVIGALICAVAIVARVTGKYWLADFQTGTLLTAGSAAMIAGCFCLLWTLTQRLDRES